MRAHQCSGVGLAVALDELALLLGSLSKSSSARRSRPRMAAGGGIVQEADGVELAFTACLAKSESESAIATFQDRLRSILEIDRAFSVPATSSSA
jgi:hypothetical protein